MLIITSNKLYLIQFYGHFIFLFIEILLHYYIYFLYLKIKTLASIIFAQRKNIIIMY